MSDCSSGEGQSLKLTKIVLVAVHDPDELYISVDPTSFNTHAFEHLEPSSSLECV